MANVVLVVIFGLPGSGKTSLCKYLLKSDGSAATSSPDTISKESLEAEPSMWNNSKKERELENLYPNRMLDLKCERYNKYDKVHYVHVCFDSIISLEEQGRFSIHAKNVQKSGASKANEVTNNKLEGKNICDKKLWKDARQHVYCKVDALLKSVLSTATSEEYVQSLLQTCGFEYKTTTVTCAHNSQRGDTFVILLDDNFYYRSMRHEYRRLAATHCVGYCQVLLRCSVQDALLRNASRSQHYRVPADVIQAMAGKLEPPDASAYCWEQNSVEFSIADVTDGVYDEFLFTLNGLIGRAMGEPEDDSAVLAMQQIKEEIATQSRMLCSKSVVHQADLILRKLVSQSIKDSKKVSTDTNGVRDLANSSNNVRQVLLLQMRAGSLCLPPCFGEEFTDDMTDLLESTLQSYYTTKLHDFFKKMEPLR